VRGALVTATDTGVGKTVLAGAIVAALVARGEKVVALKPAVTGLDEPPPGGGPHDHELLAHVAGCSPDEVAPNRFGPAVSPHLAASLAGVTIARDATAEAMRGAANDGAVLIVEGVGGLLVPISVGYSVRDLAADLGLPLVIAAHPGLGTINHTLLTLEAARAAGLSVAAIVLTPWPEAPDVIERSNRDTIARIGRVPVAVLPAIARADPELFAAAGAELPLDDWF